MYFTNTPQLKILIVAHDSSLCQTLTIKLSVQGYIPIIAANREEIFFFIETEKPDLILLDVIFAPLNGYIICNNLKKKYKIPIILLTDLNYLTDHIISIKLGANRCIKKPFLFKELDICIRSTLQQVYKLSKSHVFKNQRIFYINQLKIDMVEKSVFKNCKQIKLTQIEFQLLGLFIMKAGQNLMREEILDNIWGYRPERFSDTRVVDLYVYRLRIKLENNSSKPNLILTTRGIGYMFQNLN